MAITAKDVKKLRQMTGAGMMDCKKALTETSGDFDGCHRPVTEKRATRSRQRADRETLQGLVLTRISDDQHVGALVEVQL